LTNKYITEIVPLTLLAGSAPGSKPALAPLWKLGLRTKTFQKILTSAAQFRLIDLFLAITVYLPEPG